MGSCYFCKKELNYGSIIGYASLCPHCGKALKICYNCTFYDPNAYHECKEGVEERVLYKDMPNFCDSFLFNNCAKHGQHEKKEDAKSKFLSLFNDE